MESLNQRNYAKIKADPKKVARRRDNMLKWRARNPEKCMLIRAKHRAKTMGIIFDLRVKDVVIPNICPVLGIPLDGRDRNHAPSIDRVDNTRGYEDGNIIVVSHRANCLKNDATIEELQKLAAFYCKPHRVPLHSCR